MILYCTTYTVRGEGAFPLDMLRYDASFPSAIGDVWELTGEGPRNVTLVNMGAARGWRPSAERWAENGWHVVDTSQRRG